MRLSGAEMDSRLDFGHFGHFGHSGSLSLSWQVRTSTRCIFRLRLALVHIVGFICIYPDYRHMRTTKVREAHQAKSKKCEASRPHNGHPTKMPRVQTPGLAFFLVGCEAVSQLLMRVRAGRAACFPSARPNRADRVHICTSAASVHLFPIRCERHDSTHSIHRCLYARVPLFGGQHASSVGSSWVARDVTGATLQL